MKRIRRLFAALVALALLPLCAGAENGAIENGLYAVGVSSSSNMFKVVACRLEVADGEMTAALTLSGTGYGYLYPGTAAEAGEAPQSDWIPFSEDFEGRYTYALPVSALDEDIAVAAYSTRYSKWYDRTLVFYSDTLSACAYAAPDGAYSGVLASDTALDGSACALHASGGAMALQIETDALEIAVDGEVYAAKDGVCEIPVESLDVRIPVAVDGCEGWIRLGAASLSPLEVGAEDGIYAVEARADSNLLRITDCVLTVSDGRMTAVLTVGNNSFDYLYAGLAKDAPADEAGWIAASAAEDGAAAFEIPVASLDQDLPVATHSASQNMWFDRAVRLDSTTLKRLD